MSNGPNPGQTNQAGDLARQARDAETMRENLLIALENQIKLNELEKEKAEVLGQQLDASQKQLDINTAIVRQTSETLATIIKQTESLEGSVMTAEQLRTVLDKMNKHSIEGIEAQKEYNRILEKIKNTQNMSDEDRINALKQAQEEMEELRASMEDVKKFGDSFNSSLSSFGTKFGIANNLSSTMSGNFAKMAADFSRGFSTDKLAMITKSFSQFGITILASIVDQLGKLAIAFDNTAKSIQRAIGTTKDYEAVLKQTYMTARFAGVTIDEMGSSIQSLRMNFSALAFETDDNISKMASFTSLMTKQGVSADSSAKSIQMLSKTYGLTGLEGTKAFVSIAMAGDKAGISAKEMSDNFSSNFRNLVQFGDKATEVFMDLAAQAKATGVEMSALVGIAQKFDTFEGAATQAAKLNSVLGSNVSALELMNADYAETIEIIQDGLSGVNFDELNRFEQQYIAQAMGAKDVHEAQMILNGEADEYAAKMERRRITEEQLADIVERTVDLMSRLGMVLERVANIFEPVTSLVGFLAEGFSKLDTETDGFIGKFLTGIILLGGPIIAFGKAAFAAFNAAFGAGTGFAGFLLKLGGIGKVMFATIAGGIGAMVGVVIVIESVFQSALDYIREFHEVAQYIFVALKTIVMGLALAFIILSAPISGTAAAIAGVVATITTLGLALKNLFVDLHRKGSPELYKLPGVMGRGFEALKIGIDLAKSALSSLGSILRTIYESAMKPFISGFSMIGGILGFDMATTEDGTGSGSVQTTGPKTPAGNSSAAIQQAATEVKTLVVAQLRETGIQETANELAKIAKAMQGKEPVTNVSVNIDGRSLSDFVMRTITG
jgi:hypothetical protein